MLSSLIKDRLINILSEESSLSAKEIHNRLKKDNSFMNTYQATYKLLLELTKKEILFKLGFRYSLNPLWLQEERRRIDYLLSKVLNTQKYKQKYKDNNLTIYEFYDLKSLDNFFQENVRRICKELRIKNTYWKCFHCWWMIAYPIEEENVVADYQDINLHCDCLITRDSRLDREDLKYYNNKKDFTSRISADLEDMEVVQVIGDYVLICEVPKKVVDKLDLFYNNGYKDPTALIKIVETKNIYTFKIIKNKTLAQTYVNQILGKI